MSTFNDNPPPIPSNPTVPERRFVKPNSSPALFSWIPNSAPVPEVKRSAAPLIQHVEGYVLGFFGFRFW
jgi:hypothetical protein